MKLAKIAMVLLAITSPVKAASHQDLQNKIATVSAIATTANSNVTTLAQDNANFLGVVALTNLGKASLFVAGISTGTAGSNVVVPVAFIKSSTAIASAQVDLVIPASFTVVGVTAGPAAIAAGKSVQFGLINGSVRILVFGLNQTPIGTGTVANVTFRSIPAAPKLTYTLPLIGAVGATPEGNDALMLQTSGAVILK